MKNFEFQSEYSQENLKNYFEKADLIALGESHHGSHTEVIMTFLDNFGKVIDGFFVEYPLDYQKDIDEYLQTGQISKALASSFAGALKSGNDIENDLHELTKRLKELNKPLICVDSPKTRMGDYQQKSKHGYSFQRGESRDEDMTENILEYMRLHPGKYLFLAGAGHLEKGNDRITGLPSTKTRLKKALGEKFVSILMAHEAGIDRTKPDDYDEVMFEPNK